MEVQFWSIVSTCSIPALCVILTVGTSNKNKGVVPVVLIVVIKVEEWNVHHDGLSRQVSRGSSIVSILLVCPTVTVREVTATTCTEVSSTIGNHVVGCTVETVANTGVNSVCERDASRVT